MKGIIFTLLIGFTLVSAFNFNNGKFMVNPYRVLGIAPWSSMKEIKVRYRNLVKKYHPDKAQGTHEQFIRIHNAYEEIKQKRNEKEDSDEKRPISSLLLHTIKDIVSSQIVFVILFVISYLLYKFQSWIIKPMTYMVLSFSFFRIVLPHIFSNTIEQYMVSFIVGCFLWFQKVLFNCLCPSHSKEKNN